MDATKLKNLPDAPGVYIMKDETGSIIYVGKAKVLKNRVRQYFNHNEGHGDKVRAMIQHIDDFEYIVTGSELEALILECNLIKKHKPYYNILLKDDKQYPYIKITMQEQYPRVLLTRRVEKDGALYFGPYLASTVRETVDTMKKTYRLRSCKKNIEQSGKKSRPCLNYYIGLCTAPCSGKISPMEYRAAFADMTGFLEGKEDEILVTIEKEMMQASAEMEFEKAAILRDRLQALSKLKDTQRITVPGGGDKDVLAVVCSDVVANVQMMNIRAGKLIGRQQESFDGNLMDSPQNLAEEFMKQYYADKEDIPKEILMNVSIEDHDTLTDWLSAKRGSKVDIREAKRGQGKALIEMAKSNALRATQEYTREVLADKSRNQAAHSQLIESLGLPSRAKRIEAYDISNTAGSNSVGSMVVFDRGSANPSEYRLFKIKTVQGQDDYASLREVLARRMARAMRAVSEDAAQGFSNLPDLILADGGQGQASVLLQVVEESGLSIPVFGMVKDAHHQTRALVSPDGEIITGLSSEAFRLIAIIQNEVHRVAISYHRKLSKKIAIKSELESIAGIGKARRTGLFTHFKTMAAIKKASLEELELAPGMNKASAEKVYAYFRVKKG